MRRLTALLLVALLPTLAHADPVTGVAGFGKLTRDQQKTARAAMDRIACYHGCKGSIAHCLGQNSDTARRLARYVVYLASKDVDVDLAAKVVDRRRQSVFPDKRHTITVGDAPVTGKPSAPLTIVEYADFQCRHCAALAPILERLVHKEFKDRVALCFKVYPLRFKGPSLVTARAALAAQRQGKFWVMARLLFDNTEQHTAAGVEQLARKAGLDLERFRAAMKDTALLKQVERDKIEGMRLGIQGTPTLYFNGKPHLLRKDEYHLRERIAEELALLGR